MDHHEDAAIAMIRFLLGLAFAVAISLSSSLAGAAVQRFGVIIANNTGAADDQELRYAENDATKMHETLKSLGGFAPADLVLLKGESADTVRRTLIAVNDRLRAAVTAPDRQAVLLVYYSGHADAAALHLGRTTLNIDEVEQIVRGSAAELRLLILDSCKSGALTRVKGGTVAPPIDIRMDGRLQGEGVLFWTASAANEDAQESDALKGSFFSHYLNSALVGAGDTDGDGRVTLEEAYRYASENTIRVTSTSAGGTQHPTFRYDMRGQGKVALTTLWDTTQNRGALVIPPGKPYLVFAGSSAGSVIGEVGATDRARRISVKPGAYFVRARGPDSLLEGTLTVGAGENREVKESELTRTAYARLVRKGGGERSASAQVQLGARFHSPLPNAGGWCFGAFAGLGVDWDVASTAVRVSGCRAAFEGSAFDGSADELSVDVRLTRTVDLRLVSLFGGLELGGVLFHQRFFGATGSSAPDATTPGGSGAAIAGLAIELGRGFDLTAEMGGAVYVFAFEDAVRQRSAKTAFVLRPALGLSKTW